jgi:hypothetical protein
MKNKQIVMLALFMLVFLGLFAQTSIVLTSPVPAGLSTTRTVAPEFEWNRMQGGVATSITPVGSSFYIVEICTSPGMASATRIRVDETAVHPKVLQLDETNFLNYDTTYYWRVRQYMFAGGTDTELLNPSPIASFRTPRMSVAPYVKWTDFGTTGDYDIQFRPTGTTTWTVINTLATDTFWKFDPSVPAQMLRYDTVYEWQVRRNGSVWNAQLNFRTKPLLVYSETFNYFTPGSTPLNQYDRVVIGAGPNAIEIVVITDEIEDLGTGNAINANFTALSSISHPTRGAFRINYDDLHPSGTRSIFSLKMDLVPFDPITPTLPSPTEIRLTSGETITMKFEYGNEFVVSSGMVAGPITATRFSASPTMAPLIVDHHVATPFFVEFVTSGTHVGASKRVIVRCADNGEVIPNTYAYAISATQYALALTAAQINALYLTSTPQLTTNRPIRLEIYPAETPNLEIGAAIIWNGPISAMTDNTTASFGVPSANLLPGTTVSMTTSNGPWVRIISNVDPVGFIHNRNNGLRLGLTTDPENSMIAAGFIGAANGWVQATTFNMNPGGTPLATLSVVPQPYTPYNLLSPTNFSTNVDIYPRLEWESGFTVERGMLDMTHYKVSIATNPTFTANLRTIETIGTFAYPPQDLAFSTVYWWKVEIFPGGPNSLPTGITGSLDNPGWTFTTRAAAGYVINTPIESDRELAPGLPGAPIEYIFGNNAIVGPNATLRIPSYTTLKFPEDRPLQVFGTIETVPAALGGDIEEITLEPIEPGTTWGGIMFMATNPDPLVVNDLYEYVSGPLLKGATISNATFPLRPNPATPGLQYDIYIDDVVFENNHNGIVLSQNSYLVDTSFSDFAFPSNTAVISGGFYFDNVSIDGTLGAPYAPATPRYPAPGISTTNPSAMILNSNVANVTGNGIIIDGTPSGSRPIIRGNTVTGTGTNNQSIAISVPANAIVMNNQIGNHTGAVAADRNAGFAIDGGEFITGNTIVENGNGAIHATIGATVMNNTITDNIGYGILNGRIIIGNDIVNTATAPTGTGGTPVYRSLDAITADPDARVIDNTIVNSDGFGINRGLEIIGNTITLPNAVVTLVPPLSYTATAATTHFAITATTGASVLNNIIENPIGFGILNGRDITGNSITTAGNFTQSGAFGIKADVSGANIADNTISGMKGLAIENGYTIMDNVIVDTRGGILSQADATIINNALSRSVSGTEARGYAIRGGRIINNNKIDRFETPFSRSPEDLIYSLLLEEFKNNEVTNSTATGGHILFAEKTVPTTLEFTDNLFKDNKYTKDQIRISSMGLAFHDNQIENNFNPDFPDITGGLIDHNDTAGGKGVALYITLRDTAARMQRNHILGHKGSIYGAALYIDSALLANQILIDDRNVISGNWILNSDGAGAAVYQAGGTVILGADETPGPITITNPQILGNTITDNHVVVADDTLDYTDAFNAFLDEDIAAAGAAIHISSGNMAIRRNIIAANRGNYAIYGRPTVMLLNNIYDNYIVAPERGPDELYPAVINHNFYLTGSANYPTATHNFWGTRSDTGRIGPSINDGLYRLGTGLVTYQPILAGPSEQTPGIVSNIEAVRVLLQVPDINAPLPATGIINLPTDTELIVVVNAEDNNEFSADFTEVRIMNMDTGLYILPLCWELDLDKEWYAAKFTLSSTGEYNPEHNILPVTGGNVIRITPMGAPSRFITLMAALEGATSIQPYILEYHFGHWGQEGGALTYIDHYDLGDTGPPSSTDMIYPFKRFTFTNAGLSDDYRIDAIYIDGTNAAQFEIVSVLPGSSGGQGSRAVALPGIIPAMGTKVPAGGSFDVIVRFLPGDNEDEFEATLNVEVTVDDVATDETSWRSINLFGETIDEGDFIASTFCPFGPVPILQNQMTVVSTVTIDDRYAAFGNIVAAYTIKSMKEQLRGKYVVQQTGGLSTIIVHTEMNEEEIFFRIWDHENQRMYETPWCSNVRTIMGGTIFTRGPIPDAIINTVAIEGRSQYVFVGNVENDKDVPAPVEGVKMSNIHPAAEINSAISAPFAHVTDRTGVFLSSYWFNQPYILEPTKPGWNFNATGSVITNIWTDGATELEVNAHSFDYGYTTNFRTIPAGSVIYNAFFNDDVNVANDPSHLPTLTRFVRPGTSFDEDDIKDPVFGLSLSDHHHNNVTANTTVTFRGTIDTYVVSGRLFIHGDDELPLQNLGLDVAFAAFAPKIVYTDDRGYFYFVVDSGTVVNSITITEENLALAGYSHISPFGIPTTISLRNDGVAPPWRVESDIYGIQLRHDESFERTQVISLVPGWNIISFNVEFPTDRIHPQFVFDDLAVVGDLETAVIRNAFEFDRAAGLTYDRATPGAGTLTEIKPGAGYHVYLGTPTGVGITEHNLDPALTATLTVKGLPAKVEPIFARFSPDADRPSWYVVGYTPPKPSQTRSILGNNPDIVHAMSYNEAYFYTDDPVGASTLRFLEPGHGYWARTAVSDSIWAVIDYQFPVYNNVIRSFRFTNSDMDNLAHATGFIDNDYAGFPMKHAILDETELVHGNFYKTLLSGGIAGDPIVGEQFLFTGDTPSGGTYLDMRGPKLIDIVVEATNTNSYDDVVLDIVHNDYNLVFEPLFTKLLTQTDFDLFMDVLYGTSAVPDSLGWRFFLDELDGATGIVHSPSINLTVPSVLYLVYASQDLTDAQNREHAEMVVYRINISQATAASNELTAFTLVKTVAPARRFDAVKTGDREFTVAIPKTTPPFQWGAGANIEFSFTGRAIFDSNEDFDYSANEITALTHIVESGIMPVDPNRSTYSFWTFSGADYSGLLTDPDDAEVWKLHVVELPNIDFPLVAPPTHTSRRPTIVENYGDPFGVLYYVPNFHYVVTRITNQGQPITNNHVLGAFVNGELRGRSRIVVFNGVSYAPILVSTLTPGDAVTFRIWRDGQPVREFHSHTPINTIPGGQTGTYQNPILLNMAQTDVTDMVGPEFINDMRPAFPNPFNPTTNINFSLSAEQNVTISVFNIKGQKVKTLINDVLEMGHHNVVWNGDNSIGNSVGSGVYFIRMQTNGYEKVEKVVLMK